MERLTERQQDLVVENIYVANPRRIAELEKDKKQLEKRKEADSKIGELVKGREVSKRKIEELEDHNDELVRKIDKLEKDSLKKIEDRLKN